MLETYENVQQTSMGEGVGSGDGNRSGAGNGGGIMVGTCAAVKSLVKIFIRLPGPPLFGTRPAARRARESPDSLVLVVFL